MSQKANRDPVFFSLSPLESTWGDGIFFPGEDPQFPKAVSYASKQGEDSGAWITCRDLLDIHLFGAGIFMLLWISTLQYLGSVLGSS